MKNKDTNDEAYEEVMGFNANSLVMMVAKAELILAYYKRAGRTSLRWPRAIALKGG